MSAAKYDFMLVIFSAITALLLVILVVLLMGRGNDELEFDFPEKLPTTYIKLLDWPPQVEELNTKFSCLDAGAATERAGRTELRTVAGRPFCVTEVVQGAAGTIYSQYAYAFEHDDGTVVLTFSTRAPQCGNYPEPEQIQCAEERARFSLDKFIGKIVDEAL